MTAALEGGEWSAARPDRTLPPGKTRYSLYRRLGGLQGQSGRAENLVPRGFDPPDRPARSQSLYRLSYPAHIITCTAPKCCQSYWMEKDGMDWHSHVWLLSLILRRSRTGTVWFYTSTSNKRAVRPKLYTKSLTRDLKRMYIRLTLVRISIKL